MTRKAILDAIPDRPILEFLFAQGRPCTSLGASYDHSVAHAFPAGTPRLVILAKMGDMIRRELVNGCPCGCRGDFQITGAGRRTLR